MSKKYTDAAVNFPMYFNMKTTSPIDDRLVVESVNDLTNGTIEYPYVGIVVNIAGKEDLYILNKLPATVFDNWKRIKGADEVDSNITGVQTQLSTAVTNLTNLIDKTKKDIIGDNDVTDTLDTIK